MSSNKLSFKNWLAIFQKHSHHFAKVRIELIERSGLGVGSRESGNVAHIETRLRILFDNRRVFFYSRMYPYRRLILYCRHAVTPHPQLLLCCPCGSSEIYHRGLCEICYNRGRRARARFGEGRQKVLARDIPCCWGC